MSFAVVAHSWSEANLALASSWRGCRSLGVLGPREALRLLGSGDIALGRLDVRRTLDGPERGLSELAELSEQCGVAVLNGPQALLAGHDKLLTAHLLKSERVPTPWTCPFRGRLTDFAGRAGPFVLKPRFGSWGIDVLRAETAEDVLLLERQLGARPWLREGGAIVQELVPPLGHDLRVIVAGGCVVGAIGRLAAEGEWRTNLACGGRRVVPSLTSAPLELALRAVEATGLDLAGVDLLPLAAGGHVVLEVNAAPDFSREYSLDCDVFAAAAAALVALLERPEAAALAAAR
jgi:[lysine-biosynthesis-protein LysW]--L-2-aminoadipate ligase